MFDVGEMELSCPFKITAMGSVRQFVDDIDASFRSYGDDLGFEVVEEVIFCGEQCAYLRSVPDHHAVGLLSIALRAQLDPNRRSKVLSCGMQLGSYAQLRDAAKFLVEDGCRLISLPAELHPGIDYALHVLDLDGNCIQLYYSMEQIGWDGRPRPVYERRRVGDGWPDTIEALSDTYANRNFQGPQA